MSVRSFKISLMTMAGAIALLGISTGTAHADSYTLSDRDNQCVANSLSFENCQDHCANDGCFYYDFINNSEYFDCFQAVTDACRTEWPVNSDQGV